VADLIGYTEEEISDCEAAGGPCDVGLSNNDIGNMFVNTDLSIMMMTMFK
jgi:cobyric acid synthase